MPATEHISYFEICERFYLKRVRSGESLEIWWKKSRMKEYYYFLTFYYPYPGLEYIKVTQAEIMQDLVRNKTIA